MPQGIDLGIVLQINPKKIRTIFHIQHPRALSKYRFLIQSLCSEWWYSPMIWGYSGQVPHIG